MDPGLAEWSFPGGEPAAYAESLASAKAAAAAARLGSAVVLAADTVVVLDGEVLNKPANAGEQAAMLGRLGGRWHEVITGVAVAQGGSLRTGSQATRLRLRRLTPPEIAAYVAGGEGADKAGGYAIQGAGGGWLETMQGDRDNVIGLPMRLVRRLLPEGLLGRVGDQPGDGER